MTLREKIEVMEAFERGEVIEYINDLSTLWIETQTPDFDWRKCTYRIKPKPKQTVIIEEWLITDGKRIDVISTSNIGEYIRNSKWTPVKLLDTYEVEL